MSRQSRTSKPKSISHSSLRIIGGEWRGRRLQFPEIEGLRPTPDRVRETLFNWLMPVIAGARCLDLFAGSGALGLEALSRGASRVTFVDQSAAVKRAIADNLALLRCENASLIAADALQLLKGGPGDSLPYNLVFLDPPFRQGLLEACSHELEAKGWLAPQAYLYVEAERELASLPVPASWRLHRHKIAGQVQYALFVRDA